MKRFLMISAASTVALVGLSVLMAHRAEQEAYAALRRWCETAGRVC